VSDLCVRGSDQQKYNSTNSVGTGNRLLRKNVLVGSVLPTFKVLQEELEKGNDFLRLFPKPMFSL
jgi:hypothetical protein